MRFLKNIGLMSACAIVVIFFIAVVIGLTLGSQPLSSPNLVSGDYSYTVSQPTQGHTVVSAEALLLAYEQNEVAADREWGNRRVKVSGYVGDIGIDILGFIYITLIPDRDAYAYEAVQCYFPESRRKEIERLSKGSHVAVIGVCRGKSFINVTIKDCEGVM